MLTDHCSTSKPPRLDHKQILDFVLTGHLDSHFVISVSIFAKLDEISSFGQFKETI